MQLQPAVIDSNMLQSDRLRAWLSEAPGNIAVLPDVVWIEIYKQQSLPAVRAAVSVIGDFPDQLVVLRPGHEIAGFDPRVPGFGARMIWVEAGDIRPMLEAIGLAEAGDETMMSELTLRWSHAVQTMEGMLEGAADIAQSLPELADMLAPDELRRCRVNEPYTPAMFAKICGSADQIYEALVEAWNPEAAPLRDTQRSGAYLYRYALATVIHALWWIRNGSQASRRLDRLRNDMIDLNFAVYGSYFGDLMTDDAKARWMYLNLVGALDVLKRPRLGIVTRPHSIE